MFDNLELAKNGGGRKMRDGVYGMRSVKPAAKRTVEKYWKRMATESSLLVPIRVWMGICELAKTGMGKIKFLTINGYSHTGLNEQVLVWRRVTRLKIVERQFRALTYLNLQIALSRYVKAIPQNVLFE